MIRRAWALALVLLAAAPAAALDVPYLDGRVSDQAGILSPSAVKEISAQLAEHERKTGNQIAVLTVPSLEGEALEDFSVRVAKTWKLGQKGKDNGILLLVAPQDRKMRIEVGYGLEATLPDALAGRIIRDEITPPFRHQDYDGGIRAGVSAILGTLEGSYEPKAPERAASTSGGGLTPDMDPVMRILIGAFVFGILGLFTAIGILIPDATGWFLYFFLIPFWAMFPIVILGPRGALATLTCHLVGFPLLRLLLPRTDWGKRVASHIHTTGGGCHGSSYSSGWGCSSGGGGFSSGGGGFSGGGGSFGGGGASGSW
ncbi:MAG: TPM domain-containing protein [Elusimicrobia bacterium]|nr:TPM domain-containing protein [Elusimicrobiota bacterium]